MLVFVNNFGHFAGRVIKENLYNCYGLSEEEGKNLCEVSRGHISCLSISEIDRLERKGKSLQTYSLSDGRVVDWPEGKVVEAERDGDEKYQSWFESLPYWQNWVEK